MEKNLYKPTEDDILAVMKFIRLHRPELATPENAIKLLAYQHENYLAIEEISPETIEKILQDLESH
jgi:hypothetical protein